MKWRKRYEKDELPERKMQKKKKVKKKMRNERKEKRYKRDKLLKDKRRLEGNGEGNEGQDMRNMLRVNDDEKKRVQKNIENEMEEKEIWKR